MSTAAVNQVSLGMFLTEWEKTALWQTLVYDYSDRVAQYGSGINMPIDDLDGITWTTRAIDDVRGDTLSDHVWPAPHIPQATQVQLHVNRPQLSADFIPWVNSLQLDADQLASQIQRIAREGAFEVNHYIRAQIAGVTAAGSLLPKVTGTAANFATGGGGFGEKIYNSLRDMQERFDDVWAPTERRIAVMSVHDERLLGDYIHSRRIPYQTLINDDLLTMGAVGRLFDFDIIKDRTPGPGLTNADDAKHTIFGFLRREIGFGWALQGRGLRVHDGIDTEGENGLHVRARQLYGAALSQPSKVRIIPIELT